MEQFLAGIKSYSEVISILINTAVLGVWIFYAQLLYLNFARQRRPRLSINQTQGDDYNNHCFLVNMSKENMYVECVILFAQTSKGDSSQQIAAFYPDSEQKSSQKSPSVTQPGPLYSGEYQYLGTFGELLQSAVEEIPDQLTLPKEKEDKGKQEEEDGEQDWAKQIDTFEIRVVAICGPEERPVGGARRRFSVTPREDSIKVIPEKLVTTQMSSRAQRSEVEKWLEEWYSSSHLSGIHLKSTLTSDRILNLYLMSLITAIYTAINN
ncbi:MAG: hypothetical protein BRC53_05910 [Cyanobacteria bacterium SW_6_48_11]|nr:MAG: hypothetical protein BRC53_05910 [Cyanobacteria bacterium SW_6_48_11]